ncbi:hypothetical protein GCM10028778_03560 [Barrientosiimonas marina]
MSAKKNEKPILNGVGIVAYENKGSVTKNAEILTKIRRKTGIAERLISSSIGYPVN